MKYLLLVVLLLIFVPIAHAEDDYNVTDALSDAGAVAIEKSLTLMADDVNDRFGGIRGFIYKFINYNVDPENIPIAKDYNDKNLNIAVILAIIFIIGESLASSAAESNYPAYKNVFGEKDFSHQKYVGGGLAVIAGLGGAWVFRGIMIAIDLIDAYLMLIVMDSIEPSLDNGLLYFFMTLIELLLFGFFFYRQILIVCMYIISPIYGVFWATGYMKEFVDAIGDKFVRALIMQPICIFVTVVGIIVMKAIEWSIWGITIFEGEDAGVTWLIMAGILLYVCWWCVFGDMTIIKRSAKMFVFKKVL